MLVIDISISKAIFPVSHSVFLVPFILSYLLVNFIFTKVEGKPVYPVMNWEGIESLVYIVVASIFSLIFFFFWSAITHLRFYILNKYFPSESKEKITQESGEIQKSEE